MMIAVVVGTYHNPRCVDCTERSNVRDPVVAGVQRIRRSTAGDLPDADTRRRQPRLGFQRQSVLSRYGQLQ